MKKTWDLNELKSETATKEMLNLADQIYSYKNKALTPQEIIEIIQLQIKLGEMAGKHFSYYQLKFSENTSDKKTLACLNNLSHLSTQISDKTRFFSHNLLKKSNAELTKLIELPELKPYKIYLQRIIKDKKYLLSEKIEQIISYKSKAASTLSKLYDIHTNEYVYNTSFQKEMTEEELKKHTRSHNFDKRKESYEALLSKYKQNENLLKEIYTGIVKDHYLEAVKIRKFKSSISPTNYDNELTDKAVQALIKSVRKNNDLFIKYREIKAQILGLDNSKKQSRYDLYQPFKLSKKYTLADSEKKLKSVVSQFHKDFEKQYDFLIASNHIHSHPKKNKRGGAFCLTPTANTIPYLMLNHVDDLNAYLTFSHETGHAIHYLLSAKQGELYNGAPTALAETASIFTETLAALNETTQGSDDEKISTLMHLIDSEYASIIRQTYFTVFEQKSHDAIQNTNAKDLNDIYYETLKEQFPDMTIPKNFKYEWLHVPHMFHTPFYCYSYAFGNLLALSLYQKTQEDPSFKEKIIDLLRSGSKENTMDLLKKVDFNPEDEKQWDKGFLQIKKQIDMLQKIKEKLNQ